MEKIKKFIVKYWLFFAIIVIILIRILISSNLPSFYLINLRYDDKLMINQLRSLQEGKYLGTYTDISMVKGLIFPLFLYIVNLLNLDYTMMLSFIYIFACIYFIYSIGKIVKSKLMIFAICVFLLLNPISYSSELYQRLYRNSLTIIEMLFFLGTVVSIIVSQKWNTVKYILLGLITGIMLITREDNIWITIVYVLLVIYKLYKNFKLKTLFQALIPAIISTILLNIICYINYKNYGVYTYNELNNSNFKKAYIKILQIKDDEKKDRISIPKSTLYKLADNSKVFNITREFIDNKYIKLADDTGEIHNGKMMWYLRYWLYKCNNIKSGAQANEYFEKLSNEIDELFKEGKLEKEFVIPSVNINTPTIDEMKKLPGNLISAITYTTTYQNVKSFTKNSLAERVPFDEEVNAYRVIFDNYQNAENIVQNNHFGIEMLRIIYKYFTIIFSFIALLVYINNIKVKDKLNLVLHIIVIMYTVIICGVTYTHTTAFNAIRYCYLGNVYILQNLFILLNLVRKYEKKKENKNDISCNTSI